MRKLWLWLGASGFLVAGAGAAAEFLNGDLQLTYSQPLGPAYEFMMTNSGPTDRVVERFRVLPSSGQQVIYKLTEDVPMEVVNGKVRFPGGAGSYVPAAEFTELDGQMVSGKQQLKFRLPPLSDRPWLAPSAALIKIEYSSEPKNGFLRMVEKTLKAVSIKDPSTTVDFLVLENYWTPVKAGLLKDAMDQACREEMTLARVEACRSRKPSPEKK